ncbi:2'-5' RNA ligase family protein [Mesorhizobium sp. SB112]|uniref:2'-5' RNA ligase family protein n=1 Tax=Mesorhizobium sp. SB112 TaxID=3151853 RepID=UPI0032674A65
MSQFSFDFGDPEPKRRNRLFFTLFPDKETALKSQKIGREIKSLAGIKSRMLPIERRHMSLNHVGDFTRLKSKTIFAATQAAKSVTAAPVTVTLDRLMTFNGRPANHPCVLYGEASNALAAFHQSLALAMLRCGLRAGLDFTPHMTLLYCPENIPSREIEPISFVAKEFFLVHSLLRRTQYNVVGSWRLCG